VLQEDRVLEFTQELSQHLVTHARILQSHCRITDTSAQHTPLDMMETGNKYGGIDIERVPCKVDTSPGCREQGISFKMESWNIGS